MGSLSGTNVNLAGKSVIVTGGASGIGFGIVEFFAKHDAHITILDICKPETATSTVKTLQSQYPRATFTFKKCDISNWDEQAAVFKSVYEEQGRIDIVMANAGISQEARLIPTVEELAAEPTKLPLKTLEVNLVGTMYSVKLALHYILKNSPANGTRGSIICTASNAGIYPFPVAPIYGATKAGVINLVRSLARPLERHEVQINALAPAVLETNIAPDKALFKNMILTPMSTLQAAVEKFVTDPGLSGRLVEVHGSNVTFSEPQPYVDEDSRKNLETFWSLGYA